MASSHHEYRQHKTVFSCLVLSVFAVWTELATSQDCLRLKISKQFCPCLEMRCELSLVLSWPSYQFATWLPILTSYLETGSRLVHKCVHTADKFGQNCSVSNILKTVCDCRQLSSHRRHRQDKKVLSCRCRWCELGIIHTSSEISLSLHRVCQRGLTVRSLDHLFVNHCHIRKRDAEQKLEIKLSILFSNPNTNIGN